MTLKTSSNLEFRLGIAGGVRNDGSTVAGQIKVLKEQFGIAEVVMVGDRGMIKAKAKEALSVEGFRYIAALTDAI